MLGLSENKQEYAQMLYHNFMQCVCTGHIGIEHSNYIIKYVST